MAFPFGDSPTLGQYVNWAEGVGCTVRSGFSTDKRGGMHTVTRIETPNGRHVLVVGVEQTEFMVPTQVGYCDRRLGLKSPFFALDAGPMPLADVAAAIEAAGQTEELPESARPANDGTDNT